jgi:hypothetical protein
MRRLYLILLIIAAAFLVWMLNEIGGVIIERQFRQIAYSWPLSAGAALSRDLDEFAPERRSYWKEMPANGKI